MLKYLDTVIIIYLVEEKEPFFEKVTSRLEDSNLELLTSEMGRLECRVKPIRDQDHELLATYDQFFSDQVKEVIGITREVIDKATELRAKYNFKTPDSIHLAAAITNNCDVFLTNDHRLDRCTEIKVEVLE
jgi:predicted nucleic acid-binding protein